jgi:ectoine hydroxylase-related dioxygenase (phytanoyl-CoA dioxygenase family)
MQALEPLLGKNIRLRAGGKVNIKSAGFGAPVEWHQDWAFYPHTNDDVLAMGIMLDDVVLENGPLMVLPGSHRGAIYDHHSQGFFIGAIDVIAQGLDVSSAVPLLGSAGSMTLHHARLIHGSRMNTSKQGRRFLIYEYAAADAWPLAGVEAMDNLDDFNERVVHGEPTLEPRVTQVPVRIPLPRAPHQGSIYENQRSLANRYFEDDPSS